MRISLSGWAWGAGVRPLWLFGVAPGWFGAVFCGVFELIWHFQNMVVSTDIHLGAAKKKGTLLYSVPLARHTIIFYVLLTWSQFGAMNLPNLHHGLIALLAF